MNLIRLIYFGEKRQMCDKGTASIMIIVDKFRKVKLVIGQSSKFSALKLVSPQCFRGKVITGKVYTDEVALLKTRFG